MRMVLLLFCGFCFGALAAGGVFTVLTAVGLVPRFAGRTHTADKILLYEEMVVFGTIVGCLISIFPQYCEIGALLGTVWPKAQRAREVLGIMLQILFGSFSGMFVGCLALAIAEMLDSIPILTRRISFRHGIGLTVLSIALGKLCGSLFYFVREITLEK